MRALGSTTTSTLQKKIQVELEGIKYVFLVFNLFNSRRMPI